MSYKSNSTQIREDMEKEIEWMKKKEVIKYYFKCLLLILLVGILINANCYFSEQGVLRSVQLQDKNIVRILDTKRNIFSDSRILVENIDEEKIVYSLDTDILFNYTLVALETE